MNDLANASRGAAATDARKLFSALARPAHFAAAECLFREGDPGDSFYYIADGTVRIQLDREELDTEGVLRFIDAGTILGELALLDGQPRSASAYAETDVHAYRIDRTTLDALAASCPADALRIYRLLGQNAARTLRANTQELAAATFRGRDAAVDDAVERAHAGQEQFCAWSEKRVDALLLALASKVAKNARRLAEAAVKCTGIGNVDDKTAKNLVASMGVLKTLFGEVGFGFMPRDGQPALSIGPAGAPSSGLWEVASPVGVVFGMIPQTSPVATAIFKMLIALKGRNAVILSPHRSAIRACQDLAALTDEVLEKEGAPAGLVQWVFDRNSRRKTELFMGHPGVNLVLATGGAAMVRDAYRSGNPTLGVGPGNAPALVASDADLDACARNIVLSKTFDNGIICGGENSIVVVRERFDELVACLRRRDAVVLQGGEAQAFLAAAIDRNSRQWRGDITGQSAMKIAELTGLQVPRSTKLIVVASGEIDQANPLAREKMAPLVGLFAVDDIDAGFAACKRLLAIEGCGHTAVIYTASEMLARRFGTEMPASRVLINTPATHGIVGITTCLAPSLTLGCGTFGGNTTTDSVGYRHLLNIKRVAMHDSDKATLFDYMAHVNPTAGLQSQLLGFDTIEAEAQGCIVRDTKGNEYLDFLAGVGVMNVGHRHPRVVAAVKAQLDRMPLSSRLLFNGRAAELGRLLAEIAPGDLTYSFFCNSGTESVEAALKLARAATKRVRIISTINSFHGKTFGSLAASGRDIFKAPFGPMLPGFDHLPFGDADALRKAMGNDVAAVILEPVQGEGGVRPAPPGYLAAARALCDEFGAMLILDEVQTGLGRCGRMFACEYDGVVPDLLCLAKGLSGGVMPIGAVMGTTRAFRIFEENAFMHSTTFGGNPLACAAGIAAIEVIRDERLSENAAELGAYLVERLREIQSESDGAIAEVRGLGLLIGVEFVDEDLGAHVIAGMAQRRVIAAYTLNQPKVIRFEPPLVVTRAQCDQALAAFRESLLESLED